MRSISLRLRLLLTVLVPVAALITVVGYTVVGYEAAPPTERATDARSELARTEALERLATAQSQNVLPEAAVLAAQVKGMGAGVDPLYHLVLDTTGRPSPSTSRPPPTSAGRRRARPGP